MYAVIHAPDFFLQARLQEEPPLEMPAVLVELAGATGDDRRKARILALNDSARAVPIHPGMTAAQAQARCGEVQIFHRDQEAEQKVQTALCRVADSITPHYEDTAPGLCTLDLAGAQAGAGWDLGWEIVEELAKTDRLQTQVGIADTPDLACLVAKVADPVRSIAGHGESEFLRQLPVAALEPPLELRMLLPLWGIESVGDFLALPESELADRLGPEVSDFRERVAGTQSRLLRLVRPPRDFTQSLDFDGEICAVEPLLFALRRVLESLCLRLRSAWLTVGEIDLRLQLENGSRYARRFRVPDPTTEVDLLFMILHAHLDGFEVESPVVGLHIEMIPAQKRRRQFHLFESGLRDPNRFAETLARIEASLGSDRVGMAEVLDTHRPDAFRVVPYQEEERPELGSTTASPIVIGLPIRRFRPPIFATVSLCPRTRRPVNVQSVIVNGGVRDVRGPWPSSGDWWQGKGARGAAAPWSRVEWDVDIAGGNTSGVGGLYRLACEDRADWRVEGVYG